MSESPAFPDFSELTFAVEGGNSSAVLSVHWPGTAASGVTLGAGYDMGGRTKADVKADLVAAGVSATDADKLSGGAGKKGSAAEDWVNDNVGTLPKITKAVAQKLYTKIYPAYVTKARNIVADWGGNWDKYPTSMKEVLVDLGYRGDLVKKHEKLVESVKKNDYQAFCACIHDLDYWQNNTNLVKQKPKNKDGTFTAAQRGGYNWRIIDRSDFLKKAGPEQTTEDDDAPAMTYREPSVQYDLSSFSTDALYDHLRGVWQRAQKRFGNEGNATYDFQDEEGRVNLLAARGFDIDSMKPVPSTNTKYDDCMFLLYKKDGKKCVDKFQCTTEWTSAGASAIILLGQHKYTLAIHHKSSPYRSLVGVKAYADIKGKGYRALNPDPTVKCTRITDASQVGLVGDTAASTHDNASINIHYGGEKTAVAADRKGAWSEGCQVLSGMDNYLRFIKLIESDHSLKNTTTNELAAKATKDGTRSLIYTLVNGDFLAPKAEVIGFPIAGKNAEAHYALNEGGEGGFFPIGANNFWHGGIHLDAGSEPIRAIADGEVIAYRINRKALEINLGPETMRYSSGFVLVRHERYTPKGAKIELFSLAVHLLPFGEYSDAQKKDPPALFKKHTFVVDTAEDGKGLNVRSAATKSVVVGVLPKHAHFEVSSEQASWDTAKAYTAVKYEGISGYAYLAGGRASKVSGNIYRCETDEDTPTADKLGLNVRDAANGKRVLRVARRGEKLKFKNPAAVTSGAAVSTTWHELEDGGWVYVRSGDKPTIKSDYQLEPGRTDSVVVCKIPVAVGAILGYPGPFFSRPATVHFEVLTGDVGFMKNPKGDTGGQGTLKIPAGTKLKTRKPASTSEQSVTFADGAGTVAEEMTVDALPSSDSRVYKDKSGVTWQEISAGTAKGWIQIGKDAKLLSPYDWPGWQQIEETGKFSNDGMCDVNGLMSLLDANHDGSVTADEIKAALTNPTIAQKLRRMACLHPTEWAGELAGIDRLAGPPWNLNPAWLVPTRDYIKQLGFWTAAASAGLPPKDKVWHLHPIGIIEHLCRLSLRPTLTEETTKDEKTSDDKKAEEQSTTTPAQKFSEFIFLCGHEPDNHQRAAKNQNRFEVVQDVSKGKDSITLLHRDSEKPSPDKLTVTCRSEKSTVSAAHQSNGYAQYEFDAPFKGAQVKNILEGTFWKNFALPTEYVVEGLSKPLTVASYRPNKLKISISLPTFRGFTAGAKLEKDTEVMRKPGAETRVKSEKCTPKYDETGWKEGGGIKNLTVPKGITIALDDRSLGTEGTAKESLLGIVNLVRQVSEIMTAVQDKVPKVGWYADFNVQVMQGKLCAEWQMKEYSDHRSYLAAKLSAEMVLFSVSIEVGVGVSGCGFKVQIFAKIEGSLSMSVDVERVNPGAKLSVQ
ncbi:MAG TPA: pesticin C-terminus-like muramidase, partial [Polyangium sp.]|nr:pesticin C-terminus-like muramidase [Polyangium sp.]